MDIGPVGITDHAFCKFQERFQTGLTVEQMGTILRAAYYGSLPVTYAEMKRWKIKQRKHCTYRKGKYKRGTMVMVIKERVIVTVIRIDHDHKKSRDLPKLRREYRRTKRKF